MLIYWQLKTPKAAGRYLCANKTLSIAEVVELLKQEGYEAYRLPKINMRSSLGNSIMKMMAYTQPQGMRSYLQTHIGKVMLFDNSKIKEDLAMTFIPVEQSILDTAADLLKWGHLQPVSEKA